MGLCVFKFTLICKKLHKCVMNLIWLLFYSLTINFGNVSQIIHMDIVKFFYCCITIALGKKCHIYTFKKLILNISLIFF